MTADIEKPELLYLMNALRCGGAYGANLSSFRPTVYAFGKDSENLKNIAEEFLKGKGQVFITKPRNKRGEDRKTMIMYVIIGLR